MRRCCEASVTINASPKEVWSVISNVERVGEWSGECKGCTWVGPVKELTPGVRFRGHNRRYGVRWTRLNEVIVADEPHVFVWRTLPKLPYTDSVEWQVQLAEIDGGTRVTESFKVLKLSRVLERVIDLVPSHRDRSADLSADLARLKRVVE